MSTLNPHTPTLSAYPALALAATGSIDLDITSERFNAIMAALEVVNRLKLGARHTLALMRLCAQKSMTMTELAKECRVSAAVCTQIGRRLRALGLITITRDGRQAFAQPTDAARAVVTHILHLSALGGVSSLILKHAKP